MKKIGFIGLGHMGNPIATNLVKAGHQVTVYDVVPEAINALTAQGAQPANTIAEICKDSDVVFTMVQTGEQVSSLCRGDEGIFKHISKDALLIDCSSIDITDSRSLHTEAESLGIAMIDAPVSGGVAGAKAATLTIMIGGSEENYNRAKPLLKQMGKTIIHAGAAGNGQAAKICNNMILGISMIAVCEGFNLAKQLGLDTKKLFDISSKASGQCWSMTSYAPVPGLVESSPANNGFKPGFSASMMLKDLLLSQRAAQTNNAPTPLGAEATALYELFVNQGNGDIDFSGIIKFIEGS